MVLDGIGKFEMEKCLTKLRLTRKTKLRVLLKKRMKVKALEYAKNFPRPQETLFLLKDVYLSQNQHLINVSSYLEAKAMEAVPVRDDQWNFFVSFVVVRLIIPTAARPGNVANITLADIQARTYERDGSVVAIIFNEKHKVADNVCLFMFVPIVDFLLLVVPLAKIAKALEPKKKNQDIHVFVKSDGQPMVKAEMIFQLVNRTLPYGKKITSNVIRHVCVQLVHKGSLDIDK